MENTGNTIIALLTGAIVGAGVALLYAPEKGEETRKKIRGEAKKAKSNFDKTLHETTDRLSQSARKAKSSFDTRLEDTLFSASHKADDIMTALEKKLEELRTKNAKLRHESEKTVAKTKKQVAGKTATATS